MLPEGAQEQTQQSKHPSGKRRVDVLALLAVYAFAIVFAAWYVGSETAIYWNDNNCYQAAACFLKDRFVESPLTMPLLVVASFMLTHNLLYAAPLLPFILAGDYSRFAYVAGVVALYMVPYCLVIGGIASRVLKGNQRKIFWLTVGCALTLPAMWSPALRGYPDHAAALAFAGAVLLYIDDFKLSSARRMWTIAALLVLSVITRRHFAYDVCAFFAAAGAHKFFLLMGSERDETRTLLVDVIAGYRRLFALGLMSLLLFFTAGYLVAKDALSHNYGKLFASFEVSLASGLAYFIVAFGIIGWLLAFSGPIFALMMRRINLLPASFVFILGIIQAVTWLAVPRELGVHYLLHFTLFYVLGVSAAFVSLSNLGGRLRWAAVAVFLSYVAINALIGFAPQNALEAVNFKSTRFGLLSVNEQDGAPASWLVSANYAPQVRAASDFPKLRELTAQLVRLAPNKELVYIAGVSAVIHPDIFHNMERMAYGRHFEHTNMPDVPHVDSRDAYPLERLIKSHLVVVADPPQLFLAPEEQKLLTCVVEMFKKHWEISQDFEQLPMTYVLSPNVKVTLWKRIRPTSLAVAARTLDGIVAFVNRKPGQQDAWISSADASQFMSLFVTGSEMRDSYKIPYESFTAGHAQEPYLLSVDPLPDRFKFSAGVSNKLPESVTVSCLLLDGQGRTIEKKSSAQIAAGDADVTLEFARGAGKRLAIVVAKEKSTAGAGGERSVTLIRPTIHPL
ncbi:MAG TPA: hypothetical protein V6D17_03720 [Candidatus Obscuribacterales bacterium]